MQESRRDILKKVGTISVWSTPVVQSIVLPAHAQTSATTTAAPTTTAPTTTAPTTAAPTTAAPTTTTPCPEPVLTSGDIVFSGDLTIESDPGTSNGRLTATITNNSTVPVSLSGSFGPVGTEAFTVNLPSQLQPGEGANFTIESVEDNICSILNLNIDLNNVPFNVTATSLDNTCTGSVDINQPIRINPAC